MQRNNSVIVFDLDGTLFKTDTVTIPAVRRTCEEYGIRPPAAENICSYFGRPHSDFHTWLRTVGPQDERIEEFLEVIDKREVSFVKTAGRLYPGVPEMLEHLQYLGFELAICTNGEHEYVHEVLESHGIATHFAAVRHRRKSNDTKPVMLGDLLTSLDISKGCVVGDRKDDMDAALQNGFYAIAADYGYGSSGEFKDAHMVAKSVHDIPRCVNAVIHGE